MYILRRVPSTSTMRSTILIWVVAALVAPLVGAQSFGPGLRPGLGRVFATTNTLPLPNQGHLNVHDPNILPHNGYLYLFKGGIHLPIYRAAEISGPWEQIGYVFDKNSTIHKGRRNRPWAPTTIERNGKFYCYYTISSHGSRNSAIGVATTDTLDGRPWTDHGAIINTGKGHLSHIYPYTITNAIDASFITDNQTGKSYLNFGSFWNDIWQVPLADDLLSVENPRTPDAVQLTFIPQHRSRRPEEGSWISYYGGYYYLWFSHGRCCHFNIKGFPPRGNEYDIRVGRSRNVRGPFVDRNDNLLLDGGGTIVYASNHGKVYAPGGAGLLPGNSSNTNFTSPDILYYHYLNTSVGFNNQVSSPKRNISKV